MSYIERKWEMLRACHEELLDLVGKEKLNSIEQSIHKTGMYLALAYADFRCQDCKRGDKLSLQHLIMKSERKYTDEIRFYKMRHHWQNIIVLCASCHIKADNLANSEDTFLTLSDERIKQIRMYFNGGSTIGDAPMAVVDDVMRDVNVEQKGDDSSVVQNMGVQSKARQDGSSNLPHSPAFPTTKGKRTRLKVVPYFEKKAEFEEW